MTKKTPREEFDALVKRLKNDFSDVEDEVLKTVAQRVWDQHHTGMKEWITNRRVSETLRRNFLMAQKESTIPYACHSQYQHERAAAVYGYGFDVAPKSKVKIGLAISEGDSDPHVQIGLYVHDLQQRDIFGDTFVPCHMELTDSCQDKKEALGIIVRHRVQPCWLKDDQIIYASVADFCPVRKSWLPVVNPC